MKKGRIHFGIGMVSIFMIFVVLCFTIITALTYIKASDQEKLSIKHVEYTKEYYQADSKARKMQGKVEYLWQMGDFIQLDTYCKEQGISKEQNTYHYYVKINEKQQLEVLFSMMSTGSYVSSWKTIVK